MNPDMKRRALLAFAALSIVPCASAAAATPQRASGTLGAKSATARACHTGAVRGRGVVKRTFRAPAAGLVRARLSGGRGDWDVAVLDTRNRPVAASAAAGTRELAEGVARTGQRLTVQACRRPGASRTVRLRTETVPVAAPSGAGATTSRLVRVALPTAGATDALESLGLDLAEHAGPGFRDVVVHSAADEAALRRAGLRATTLVDDLAAATRRALAPRRSTRQAVGGSVPSGRTSYRRLADYSAEMKGLAAANPDLVRSLTLPLGSLEGRPLEGIEVGADVSAADGRPVLLQMGLHHAREWPSGEHVLEWAIDLVKRFRAGDARTVDLLRRARVILVPVVNPDGFSLSREAPIDLAQPILDLGFAYKRRNCRVNDGVAPAAGACGLNENRARGVDLNRNYGVFWGGPGASDDPLNDTYRGAGPFSEPETESVRRLIASRQVTALITNHTYGDLILRSPGVAADGDAPDEGPLQALGARMAAHNGYANQKGFELYDTTGTTEDWSYYTTGGLGYTFEIGPALDGPTGLETLVGTGFHPPYPIGVIAEYTGKRSGQAGNREAYFEALKATADPALHSVVTGVAGPGRRLRLAKSFESFTAAGAGFPDRLESTMTVPSSGRFEWHVNPSTRPYRRRARAIGPATTESWTLTCEEPSGAVVGRRTVTVDRGARVDVGRLCSGASPAAAPGFSFAVDRRRLGTALRRGLRARARCTAACRVSATLSMPARTARRLGLTRGRRSVVVARVRGTRSFTGRRTVTLRFTARARRALRRTRRVSGLRATATARLGATRRTARRTVTLRR